MACEEVLDNSKQGGAVLGIIRTVKILQKIEFWLFSVPALVVAIGGIAHYGVWRVLWVFPVCFVLNSALRFGKKLPVELLDGPRIRACRSGKWPRAYLLVLPLALYDWFVSSFLVDFAGLLVARRQAFPRDNARVACCAVCVCGELCRAVARGL